MANNYEIAYLVEWVGLIDKHNPHTINIHGKTYTRVVRCKDCVYYIPEVDNPHKSNCQRLWGGMIECNADSYCSDGVRKDEVK